MQESRLRPALGLFQCFRDDAFCSFIRTSIFAGDDYVVEIDASADSSVAQVLKVCKYDIRNMLYLILRVETGSLKSYLNTS